MNNITAIILTYNEEKNIENCLHSIVPLTTNIILVDSGSTDKTLEIAKRFNVSIYNHEFLNHSKQFNWALDNIKLSSEWILRIDADERLTENLIKEIHSKTKKNLLNKEISGYILKFRTIFMGKELRFGGVYPFRKLVLFKKGSGRYEDRNMDEHILLSQGKADELNSNAFHYDYKDIHSLVQKHNLYATKELMDFNNESYQDSEGLSNNKIRLNRKKKKLYYNFPLFFRAFLFFLYNYVLRFGFLDGQRGLIYHFITTFYYRFLVDAKLFEQRLNNSLKK
jgi:glycosyltransferase involved in cell wall biosynthesis